MIINFLITDLDISEEVATGMITKKQEENEG